MKISGFGLHLLALTFLHSALFASEPVERRDWGTFFADAKATGSIVVLDERPEGVGSAVFDPARATKRFSPASTFKIPHALFALDAGVVRDEFQKFAWDGKVRTIEPWNRDQNLRSSMRHSVVWVYEKFAKEIGENGERNYLKKTDYGNADPSGDHPFWIDGNLSISALEQIHFLRRLYRNELPFPVEHQRLVKDIMIVEADRDTILRAKTGWSGTVGWWVGWVESPTGPIFFALNIDTPARLDDLPKREIVVRGILESIGALPKK
jgi:beta-lactamase class D